jgi:CRISPR-associated protein Csx10
MFALLYQIKLLEPVLVMDVGGGDPNSATSLNYLPGSSIRGVAIAAWQNAGNSPADQVGEFRQLFLDGTLQYLHAYPINLLGERMLPAPLSWKVLKENAGSLETALVHNFAWDTFYPSATWKTFGDAVFCSYNEKHQRVIDQSGEDEPEEEAHSYTDDEISGEVYFQKNMRSLNIHIARSNRQQVTRDGSTIYRYEALSRDQSFGGIILSEDQALLQKIAALLPNDSLIRIGKSARAGYGKARVLNVRIKRWRGEFAQEQTSTNTAAESIQVTLLSHLLLRDRHTGAFTTDLPAWLGIPKQDVLCEFSRTLVAGGFNRTWNLPTPQVPVLQSGSVFVFRADPGLLQKLQAYENQGLGEKRVEGFGRIALNWHMAKTIQSKPGVKKDADLRNYDLANTPVEKLARRTLDRILHKRMEVHLYEALSKVTLQRHGIQNSQLSTLRSILQRAWQENKLDKLSEYLGDVKSTARNQLRNARIDNSPLYDWLLEITAKPGKIWVILNVSEEMLPSLGGLKPLLKPLEIEFSIRFLDGMLNQALKNKGG